MKSILSTKINELGNQLLSEDRKQFFASHPEADDMPPLKNRLSQVNDIDLYDENDVRVA